MEIDTESFYGKAISFHENQYLIVRISSKLVVVWIPFNSWYEHF